MFGSGEVWSGLYRSGMVGNGAGPQHGAGWLNSQTHLTTFRMTLLMRVGPPRAGDLNLLHASNGRVSQGLDCSGEEW